MINRVVNTVQTQNLAQKQPKMEKILTYRKNERMGGMVPVWETRPVKDVKEAVEAKLSAAQTDPSLLQDSNLAGNSTAANAFTEKTAAARQDIPANPQPAEPFGFGDLLDIVNPLQHIPLVSSIYRNITGDTIQPASRVLGGIVFGGGIGGGVELANVIAEHETGADLTGNLVSAVTGSHHSAKAENTAFAVAENTRNPEKELNAALTHSQTSPQGELPGNVLSFVDLGNSERRVYEKFYDEDDRINGAQVRIHNEVEREAPGARQPITQVVFDHSWRENE